MTSAAEQRGDDAASLDGEASPGSSWPEADRRRGDDRRDEPTPGWTWLAGHRRRRRGRRAGESQNAYVDAYNLRDLILALAILALNILDAFFTLSWVERGGSEGNPFMREVLDLGPGAFLFQKCVLAGFWLVVLTVHKNFRLARAGLYSLLAIYVLLLLYHLLLFFLGEPVPAPIEPVVFPRPGVS